MQPLNTVICPSGTDASNFNFDFVVSYVMSKDGPFGHVCSAAKTDGIANKDFI